MFKDIADSVTEDFFDEYTKTHLLEARKSHGSHLMKKIQHTSDIFRVTYKQEDKLEIEFVWIFCEKCGDVRNKYVIAWNSDTNVAFEKVLRKPSRRSKSEF